MTNCNVNKIVCGTLALFWSFACVAHDASGKEESASVERLLFEQGGATRDSTLAPFSITIGAEPDASSRAVVFVPAETFEKIKALVRQRNQVSMSNSATSPENYGDGFEVSDNQKDGTYRTYHIPGDDMKMVMQDVISSFVINNEKPPPWVLAIGGAR